MSSLPKYLVLLSTALITFGLPSSDIAGRIAGRVSGITDVNPAIQFGPPLRRAGNNRRSCLGMGKNSTQSLSYHKAGAMATASGPRVKVSSHTSTHPNRSSKVINTMTPKATSTSRPKTKKKKKTKAKSKSASYVGVGPSYMRGTQMGDATYYGTGLGACGLTNHDTDYIVAVSHLLFDTFPGYRGGNPNNNPICGRKVTASYQGNSVTVAIVDRCTGCAMTDLDFSPAAFNKLGPMAAGRLHGMTWYWN